MNLPRFLTALLALFALAISAPSARAVQFPDKNLEAALRTQVFEKRDDASKELTEDDLRKISILKASGKGITNLSGIEHCKGLLELDLSKNQVADVALLGGLSQIQSLHLAGNQIKDAAPLMSLTALQYLDLSNNQIEALPAMDPLAGRLTVLMLSGNQIKDIAPLNKLTRLVSLHLNRNQLVDVSVVGGFARLSLVNLSDNAIENVAPLGQLNQLSMLILERNKVADVAPLVASCKADAEGPKRFAPFLRLYLAGNPLSDAAKTAQLPELQKYGVRVAQ